MAAIGTALAGVQALPAEAEEFLAWSGPDGEEEQAAERTCPDNFYRYPLEDPQVSIRLGSIHAVKGETHTATLVLDTFHRAHHLKTLKPWLLGNKSGGNAEGDPVQRRLKLHYVGMTRPARLLCLAMRNDALNEAEIAKLRERGWRVGRVSDAGAAWVP